MKIVLDGNGFIGVPVSAANNILVSMRLVRFAAYRKDIGISGSGMYQLIKAVGHSQAAWDQDDNGLLEPWPEPGPNTHSKLPI